MKGNDNLLGEFEEFLIDKNLQKAGLFGNDCDEYLRRDGLDAGEMEYFGNGDLDILQTKASDDSIGVDYSGNKLIFLSEEEVNEKYLEEFLQFKKQGEK